MWVDVNWIYLRRETEIEILVLRAVELTTLKRERTISRASSECGLKVP